jgi:hypothetical protein
MVRTTIPLLRCSANAMPPNLRRRSDTSLKAKQFNTKAIAQAVRVPKNNAKGMAKNFTSLKRTLSVKVL